MDYKSYRIFETEAVTKVLEGIHVADCMNLQEFESKNDSSDVPPIIYNLKELAVSDVLSCSYCSVSFEDASQQRNHYKLDWHRYNLKRALSGNKSVTEEVFNTLADGISSISGSGSESSEDSDTENNENANSNPEEQINLSKSKRHAKVFFENNEQKILSIYKCLLQSKKENPVKEELIKQANILVTQTQKWLIVLLGGGHFAAAIFDDGDMICHKTFHCYTVRAKQGGSQSTRDNKGGSHPKSAGASLRRYNEQALIEHVQEIIAAWKDSIKLCSLILFRAPGPYNRGVLFGGKNPPLSKTDERLRNIPFPTKRATMKEVKRVYEMLSSVEVYGSAESFKNKFPPSPDKRTWSPKTKRESSQNAEDGKRSEEKLSKKRDTVKNEETSPSHQEIVIENIKSESESEGDDDFEIISGDITVSFEGLQEYEDTVPQYIKDLKNRAQKPKKKRKKLSSQQKLKLERKKWTEEFNRIQSEFVKSCENRNKNLLVDTLNLYEDLPVREETNDLENKKPSAVFTKEDFIDCLNAPVNEDNKNTILHLAAIKGLPEFITLLLTSGADPTVRNKNKLTPYVIADKDTRNAFRDFAALFPDKYDLKKANIPEPLTEEQAKELEEKKKEKKKLKREKEKIKKQENKEKRHEEEEKKRFLALSDREKCALAAERRLVASSTSNLKSAKPPVLSRCFQCGTDITGIVAFEYGSNRFCTIPCLKAHRLKTNSFGKEI